MNATHKMFLAGLDESSIGVQRIVRWFEGRGKNVRVPETTKAKTHAEWKKHADDGDLFLVEPGGGGEENRSEASR